MNEMPGYICFDKLFALMKEKHVSVNELKYQTPSIQTDLFGRLRAGKGCTTKTIAALCSLLNCQPGDIMEYVKSSED